MLTKKKDMEVEERESLLEASATRGAEGKGKGIDSEPESQKPASLRQQLVMYAYLWCTNKCTHMCVCAYSL
jgi:hypothetical protein